MKKIIIPILSASILLGSVSSANAYNFSDWAVKEYYSANTAGLISQSVISGRPSANISRAEFCELVMNLYMVMTGETPEFSNVPFTDTNSQAVKMAYSLGVIDGKTETEFYPQDPVLRQEMAKIIMRTLNSANKNINITAADINRLWRFSDFGDTDAWATNDMAKSVKYEVINGFSDRTLLPKGYATREQAIAIVNRAYNTFADSKTKYAYPKFTDIYDGAAVTDNFTFSWNAVSGADGYTVLIKDTQGNVIKSFDTENLTADVSNMLSRDKGYTVIVGAKFGDYITVYSDPAYVFYGEEKINILVSQADKYNRVFPGGKPFTTKAQADSNMRTINVPVWQMDEGGNKYSNNLPLVVNVNLADEVMQIFTNIYNSPERFPIKDIGGYSFRNTAFGSVSHHSYGTCIDINFDENYYCYPSGEAITGSFWRPYENPFSITPDGSVVRNFKKYGWTWGGDWTNLKDYMHFSYLGK
ncbi:MAG: S-layer homology domain-containing protein [Clostridia bacterium]|nr:S-layer homology domain-containing protein [Clostridia bacterium]